MLFFPGLLPMSSRDLLFYASESLPCVRQHATHFPHGSTHSRSDSATNSESDVASRTTSGGAKTDERQISVNDDDDGCRVMVQGVTFGGDSSPACLEEVEGRGRQVVTRASTRSRTTGRQHKGAVRSDRRHMARSPRVAGQGGPLGIAHGLGALLHYASSQSETVACPNPVRYRFAIRKLSVCCNALVEEMNRLSCVSTFLQSIRIYDQLVGNCSFQD
jgi:hypothetical protein